MQAISIIAAHAKNKAIGLKGDLPWRHVKEITKPDFKHFQDLTIGNPVIMGKNTFYSIPKKYRPLKERENIVLSTSEYFRPEPGVIPAKSIDEALRFASVTGTEEAFIIGGESVFKEAIRKYALKIYLTEIKQDFEGDRHFPKFDTNLWSEVLREKHELFDFVEYHKTSIYAQI